MGDVIPTISSSDGDALEFLGSAPELPACSMAPGRWVWGFRRDEPTTNIPAPKATHNSQPSLKQREGEQWVGRPRPSDVTLTRGKGSPLKSQATWERPCGPRSFSSLPDSLLKNL